MAVLNTDGYYYIDHFRNQQGFVSEWRDDPPHMYTVRDFDDGWDYYYLEFKNDRSITACNLSTLIADDILKRIRDPGSKVLLLLNNSHEAFVSVVEPIYKHFVLEQQIPADKILLLTGAFDILVEIERVRDIYQLPSIKAEIEMSFEENAATRYHVEKRVFEDQDNPDYDTWAPPVTLHDGPYQKKFLNFNRRWRLHRPTFVMLLKHLDILDQGFVSLAKADDDWDWPGAWEHIVDMHSDFPKIIKIATDLKQELLALPDMYLDTQDLVTNRAPLTMDHNYLYEQSYFSLISETHFYVSHLGYENTRFLSEKVWKSVLFKHPFIVISSPGILKCLKYIGYQTFDGIIDESYDKIQNDGDRLLAIAEETKRLCNLSPAELSKFIQTSREICEHNFNVLINKKQFHHKLNYK